MANVLSAVLPIFLLIAVGYAIRARGLLGESFWAPAERLTYFVLFPTLITVTLARADLRGLEALPMAAALISAILIMTLIALWLRRRLKIAGPPFTSIYQGVVRMNTYIGLALCAALYNTAGLTLAALAMAVIVPSVNVLCVAMLARYGSAQQPTPRRVLGQVARNPLILACIAGAALNFSGIGIPPLIGPVLEILGRAALPPGLLAVGAGLDFKTLGSVKAPVGWTTGLRLVGMPLLTAGTCWIFDVQGITATVAILYNGLPTATSAYILARQLGGDPKLMAAITTLQTATSMVTLPFLLTWTT